MTRQSQLAGSDLVTHTNQDFGLDDGVPDSEYPSNLIKAIELFKELLKIEVSQIDECSDDYKLLQHGLDQQEERDRFKSLMCMLRNNQKPAEKADVQKHEPKSTLGERRPTNEEKFNDLIARNWSNRVETNKAMAIPGTLIYSFLTETLMDNNISANSSFYASTYAGSVIVKPYRFVVYSQAGDIVQAFPITTSKNRFRVEKRYLPIHVEEGEGRDLDGKALYLSSPGRDFQLCAGSHVDLVPIRLQLNTLMYPTGAQLYKESRDTLASIMQSISSEQVEHLTDHWNFMSNLESVNPYIGRPTYGFPVDQVGWESHPTRDLTNSTTGQLEQPASAIEETTTVEKEEGKTSQPTQHKVTKDQKQGDGSHPYNNHAHSSVKTKHNLKITREQRGVKRQRDDEKLHGSQLARLGAGTAGGSGIVTKLRRTGL